MHLKDNQALGVFFQDTLVPIQTDDQVKNAARAWLRLTQEYLQDGYYKFTIPDASLKVIAVGPNKQVTGEMAITAGGKGDIKVTMLFNPAGKMAKLAGGSGKIFPSPRPTR